ncbi:MAG: family 20 glycosylhydrolase [Clostridia bacterium]|nr:family 20 glycosylhydrolase [Clostridia bacterium]
MIFNINGLSSDFRRGLAEYKDELDIRFAENGISVSATQGDTFAVNFDGKTLRIVYQYKSEFYRAIAMVIANGDGAFTYTGKRYFKDFGIHHATRPYVPHKSQIKKLLRRFALMGYSQFEMYMHSNFEVDGEPYFGYGQGRYTQAELCEIAAYGDMLGVEVVPCLELLAHQPELKRWKAYAGLYDWDDIFNVGREETYQLIEKMIATCAKCFKSKVMNLGMDEAYMLGHGQYFRDNGEKLENRVDIFLKHLSRVVTIAQKYGYEEQIIWSDMLYASYNNYSHFGPNQLPKDVIERIPASVKLAYWDYYGTADDHYNWCMKNHVETGCKVMFAAGVWTWEGTLAHNRFSMEILQMSLGLSKKNGIDNLLITSWGNAPLLFTLPSLCFAAQIAYDEDTGENMKAFFKVVAGCEFDDYMLLDTPNYTSHDQAFVYPTADQVLLNDYFIGLMDSEVIESATGIWDEHIVALESAKGRCKGLEESFERSIAVCKIAKLKYDLGLKTRRAYKSGDKTVLAALIENAYKPLVGLYEEYLQARKAEWRTLFKSTCFEKEVIQFGGMIARTKYCIDELQAFIDGKIDCIEELDAVQLDAKGGGEQFNHDGRDRSCTLKTAFSPCCYI